MIGIVAIGERQLAASCRARAVARVVRMHGDRGVAEHRLGRVVATTSSPEPSDRVRELAELAVRVLFVLDLEIGHARSAASGPS